MIAQESSNLESSGDSSRDLEADERREREQLGSMIQTGEIFSHIQALKTTVRLLQREKKQMKRKYESQVASLLQKLGNNDDRSFNQEELREESLQQEDDGGPAPTIQQIKKERDALRKQCQLQLVTISALKKSTRCELSSYETKGKAASDESHVVDVSVSSETELEISSSTREESFHNTMFPEESSSSHSSRGDSILHCEDEVMIEVLKDENIKLQTQAGSLMAVMERQALDHQILQTSTRTWEKENKDLRKRILELEHDNRILTMTNRAQEESIETMDTAYRKREEHSYQAVLKMSVKLEEYEDEKERLLAKCTALEFVAAEAKQAASCSKLISDDVSLAPTESSEAPSESSTGKKTWFQIRRV